MSGFFRSNPRELLSHWLSGLLLVTCAHVSLTSLVPFDASLISSAILQSVVPLTIAFVLARVAKYGGRVSPYLLFFSVSVTSLLGLTQTLTGSHAESTNALLFGLSFYTVSLAFLLKENRLRMESALIVSNPLLLATGPIATQFGSVRHRAVRTRLGYYAPFVVLGLFLHQALATPLTETFFLLRRTDVVSAITFAAVFELFVYANFCGLSLVVYGVSGILGFRVPLNFRQPFSATNLIEFWRGWHVSLSTALKSLFYVPARKHGGTHHAVFAVFLASAMWHGVTPNFALWGAFHALLFTLTIPLLRRRLRALPAALLVVGVLIGRMLFADANTQRLLEKLRFSFDGFSGVSELLAISSTALLALLLACGFVLAECVFRNTRLFRTRNYRFYRLPIVQLILLVLTLAMVSRSVGASYAVYGQR